MALFNVDFHHHCSSDPVDHLFYDDFELIDRASAMGLHAIAITPHGKVHDNPAAVDYATSKGLLLIPGVEKMIEGYEIGLLNVSPGEIPARCSFEDLRRLRTEKGRDLLVFAPHPFYPRATCAGPVLDRIPDLIDAVEYAHLYFRFYNRPNRRAVAWAEKNGKPVIANSDSHDLSMVGRNYSAVEADGLTARALFDSIRAQPPRLVTRPYTIHDVARFLSDVILPMEIRHLREKFL